MPHYLALLALGGVLALAGCATNQAVAAKRCTGVAGQAAAYDQCVARELARLAEAQGPPPPSKDSGGY